MELKIKEVKKVMQQYKNRNNQLEAMAKVQSHEVNENIAEVARLRIELERTK